MKYIPSIGLEIHLQLNTKSKAFCSCPNNYGQPYNTLTCPVCLGYPGALPVLNKEVVAKAATLALALNCEVDQKSRFDRKNYFYPDLTKGYQITQFDRPIGKNGTLTFEFHNAADNSLLGQKTARITEMHIEEDAGKSLHVDGSNYTLVDYNRCSVPLVEVVSEPDLSSAEEAYGFLEALKQILLYLDVCDGNQEMGQIRCDVNVSLRPEGTEELGNRTEAKNVNSFRSVERYIRREIERQSAILDRGEKVHKVTFIWDEAKEETIILRDKEAANDYRFFPEPDLLTVAISPEMLADWQAKLPELPLPRKNRFMQNFQLSAYDAAVLTKEKSTADFFEETVQFCRDPKAVCNWIMTEIFRLMKEKNFTVTTSGITTDQLADLINLINKKVISSKIAKELFEELLTTDKLPNVIVAEKGLVQNSDTAELEKMVDEILSRSQKEIEQYKAGKTNLLGFFVGQVMKATKGKANPQIVDELFKQKLTQ